MAARITLVSIRWDPVVGSTGYDIVVDGRKVATAGAKATTTRVTVDNSTLVEIVDLPARQSVQALQLTQELL